MTENIYRRDLEKCLHDDRKKRDIVGPIVEKRTGLVHVGALEWKPSHACMHVQGIELHD